ncbi:hypothetical protein WICMUC_002280 [Wickerhamomyces mucosus]|uniref:Magnesium transport protein CorA n=1 Tax=Wickerhamomyces mucosus TaxID=1378264 RepID=A0A9P8PR46_9ASCO|nr:hypothetical protein WICMUC_002280 [Wickerhamomyces mucosus]
MPKIYDSGDPTLPNLPPFIYYTNESDEYSEDENLHGGGKDDNRDSDLKRVNTNHSRKVEFENSVFSRKNSNLFDDDSLPQQPFFEPEEIKRHLKESSNTSNTASYSKSKKRRERRRKKNRKYSDSAYSSTAARQRISWEPGIDINTTEVILSSIGSAITITDYNQERYRVENLCVTTSVSEQQVHGDSEQVVIDNDEEEEKPTASFKDKPDVLKLRKLLNSRPQWSTIRWVNVNGISWEAIATIGEHYKLHRLAIEDMIDIPQRTKIDFFHEQLFGVVPLIKLVRNKDAQVSESKLHDILGWVRGDGEQKNLFNPPFKGNNLTELIPKLHQMRRLNQIFQPAGPSKRKLKILDDERPLSYRNLFVGIEQVSFFILSNNTVLTFFESSGDDIENAILNRITSDETILRTSCESSILLQSILDAIVDMTYPILTAYRKRLGEFEINILTNPNLKHTQALHLMNGELSKLRRSILPITSLVNALKDLSRKSHNGLTEIEKKNPAHEFISPMTRLYLSDIIDHLWMYTDEIDGMISQVQNLTAMIFNTISTQTNGSMRQLSIVTVIFLPLSFWTGYFGMNFTGFTALEQGVELYWKISIPFSFGLLLLLMWSSLKKNSFKHYKSAKKFKDELSMRRNYQLRSERRKSIVSASSIV